MRFLLLSIWFAQVYGCSDFLLNVTNGEIVSGRTMDYEFDLKTVIEVIPENSVFNEAPVANCENCADVVWRNKFGFVALNAVHMNLAVDGMNVKGLSAAFLYLTETEYPKVNGMDTKVISNVCSYIMGNFETVEQVKAGIGKIQIGELDAVLLSNMAHVVNAPKNFPLHIAVHDRFGKSLVVEFIHGKVEVYDNHLMVMTNGPSFDWHLKNVRQDEHGDLPGGYGSVDRFMRLYRLNQYAGIPYTPGTSYANGNQEQLAISSAVHVLNTVVRPPGIASDGSKIHPSAGATQWSIFRDHKHMVLYYKTTENQVLRSIQLNSIDFMDQGSRKDIPMDGGIWALDMTGKITSNMDHNKTNDLPPRSILEKLKHATQMKNLPHVNNNVHGISGTIVGCLFVGIGVMILFIGRNQNKRHKYEQV